MVLELGLRNKSDLEKLAMHKGLLYSSATGSIESVKVLVSQLQADVNFKYYCYEENELIVIVRFRHFSH